MSARHFFLIVALLLCSGAGYAIEPITGLNAVPDATSVRLSWTPYAGSQTVAEYRLIRNGIYAGSTIGRWGYFTDHGLAPGLSYSYKVEGLNEEGAVICASTAVRIITTTKSTIRTHYNLLALVFTPEGVDPEELSRIRTFLKYRIEFLKLATHNSVNLELYQEDITLINAYPPLEPNSKEIDYEKLAATPYPELGSNSMVDLVERYDVDIVWVLGGPPDHDFGENMLMGNSNLGSNTWWSRKVKCSRSFFIHSNSPDARAFDAAAHHVEGTMTSATERSPHTWPRDKEYMVYTKNRFSEEVYPQKLNLFEQFRLTDEWTGVGAYASKGNANCGSSHFVPGSIRASQTFDDYTYYDEEAWKRYVDCYADEWLIYPQRTGIPRKINGYDFGAFNDYQEGDTTAAFGTGTASFHLWWFSHIPHNPGLSDGKLNNWWPYIYDCNRFDGRAITYAVDGFPEIPDSYGAINHEWGTEEADASLWAFWHTATNYGQRADLAAVSRASQPALIKQGESATKVAVEVAAFPYHGRNDLFYPRYKNAQWDLTDLDTISFSVKFEHQYLVQGTNPIFRLCTNGNTRIEYVPRQAGVYTNMFRSFTHRDDRGWYTFKIPVLGNETWQRNLIGYIDPELTPEQQAQEKQRIILQILKEVNYVEISIRSEGSSGESLVYYIDALQLQLKDRLQPERAITSFSLIDQRTGATVQLQNDSLNLDKSHADFSHWVIQANTVPENIGVVAFSLNGKVINLDSIAPYRLSEELLSTLTSGQYALTARVLSATGQEVIRTLILSLHEPDVSPGISAFEVVDLSGKLLMTLSNGAILNRSDPAFSKIAIRARTSPEDVGLVRFWLNGRPLRTDPKPPYAPFGEHKGTYKAWEPAAGTYTLLATSYPKQAGKKDAGKSLQVRFTINNDVLRLESTLMEVDSVSGQFSTAVAVAPPAIVVYPMPAERELHLQFSDMAGSRLRATLYTGQGQRISSTVYTVPDAQRYSISLLGLPPGMYFLRLAGEGGFTKTIKFIKK
jgi:hypothetical protein